MSVRELSQLINAVGFSSPPAWLRPYCALSTGEQFRITVARILAERRELAVIDEFTSVVDRQVAKVACHAAQKAIRNRRQRLVAVSCHYDIIDWLQPDWLYQPGDNHFARRSLQRHPAIELAVYKIDRAAWRLFSKYHYMSSDLASAAQCFGGFVDGQCVAFSSYLHFPHPQNSRIKMGHRLVVHPDYQGLGIGGRLDDWLGEWLWRQGFEYHNVVTHPAMIAYYAASPRWRRIAAGRKTISNTSSVPAQEMRRHTRRMAGRFSHSFVYVPTEKRE